MSPLCDSSCIIYSSVNQDNCLKGGSEHSTHSDILCALQRCTLTEWSINVLACSSVLSGYEGPLKNSQKRFSCTSLQLSQYLTLHSGKYSIQIIAVFILL